jgi:HD-GYP domain-containing protein (c-di-GMP phosphodiesterase class II)
MTTRSASPTTSASTRLADLVAAFSLAIDLATGQPLEHTLRTCLLSVDLARRSGVGGDDLRQVYDVALLRFSGATAAAAETSAVVGDDLAFTSGMGPAFMGSSSEQLRAAMRSSGAGDPAGRRARHRVRALWARHDLRPAVAAHVEAAAAFARRLGMTEEVVEALGHAFERWDGRGVPGDRGEEGVPPAVRVATVARDIDLWQRVGGTDAATAVVRARAGRGYDPTVAAAFLLEPDEVLRTTATSDAWQEVLDLEPGAARWVDADGLDEVLRVFADFADLKSPWLRGHSAGVATLTAEAAHAAGLDELTARRLRRAGLVHDLGRVAVANTVWDRPGELSASDQGWVREHPYLAERILARSAALAPLGRLAADHHERADGSGYPRGTRSMDPCLEESLLAAADTFHALTEPRPHRPAMPQPRAGEHLVREVAAGRLPREAVEAVLVAADHMPPRRRGVWPGGLTDREVDVLRLVVRGESHREMAASLGMASRVVATYVNEVYEKLGVHTRAGAALFAMQHGLLI